MSSMILVSLTPYMIVRELYPGTKYTSPVWLSSTLNPLFDADLIKFILENNIQPEEEIKAKPQEFTS